MNQWIDRIGKWIAVLGVAVSVAAPSMVQAQSIRDLDKLINRRQDKKNEWRNIAIASGAVGILGLLNHDSTLTFVGTAGALYSAYRYEQDRKSQSKLNRTRAAYFSRGSFTRNGKRYVRKTTWKRGKKYYYFARA
ncbi:MAG: hypothetical protein IT203_01720 [Fimbriimonadaceae bacterium]|nr:hypothetical protein [Fimbriimonadaceae bacterium]